MEKSQMVHSWNRTQVLQSDQHLTGLGYNLHHRLRDNVSVSVTDHMNMTKPSVIIMIIVIYTGNWYN